MAFDSFVPKVVNEKQYADFDASAHQDSVRLVNYLLDSSHTANGRADVQPHPWTQPLEQMDPVAQVIQSGAQRGFTDNDDLHLRTLFNENLHVDWTKGGPVADLVNQRLQDAALPYRIRFEGPFKAPGPFKYPGEADVMYEYRLTVTDLAGKSLNQLPMTYVKEQ